MKENSFWDACIKSFEKNLPRQQFNMWIKPIRLSTENGCLIFTAPDTLTLKLLQNNFFAEIRRQAMLVYGVLPKFEFRVGEDVVGKTDSCGNRIYSGVNMDATMLYATQYDASECDDAVSET